MAEIEGLEVINVNKAERESAAWGIPLVDWMELEIQIRGSVDVFGHAYVDDDVVEERWRSEVAVVLIEAGLVSKANRFVECSRYAYLYQCEGPDQHRLFSPIYCDLRFCPRCAPRQFARLLKKYEPIVRQVYSNQKPGFRLREITLTSANLGSLNSAQVRRFNQAAKTTLKKLMRKVRGWGAIWCDEVGFDNTNLHAHVLFYGPYIPQRVLAQVWNEVSGHQVVWINEASGNGSSALLYLLKYVSKAPTRDANRVGQLEVAFHKTRRIHSLGVFYRLAGRDPDNEYSEWTGCPHCGADIEKQPGHLRIENAILEGRTFVGTKHTARRREWVN
ncbi:MAG: hypothetical protein C5B58_14380 [Acidobacteria bacterium]|nr:MAG: hypothetical protein C5B58_14380 [Acidobacteriota bacterium]